MDEDKLIGHKVQHRKTHAIGMILSIHDGKIEISFHGKESCFPYPSAFSNTLVFEDEDIQRELENSGAVAGFEKFQKLYGISLNNEIRFLRETGGKKYKIIDGERLQSQNGEYIYAFDTDTEYHFPDNTAIKLWRLDSVVSAYIISCEEYTVIIRSMEYLGEKVDSIEFTAASWQLLEALIERVSELSVESSPIAYKIACEGITKVNERSGIICGQGTAIRRARTEPVTFIWGPPGTGKTYVLASIALDYITEGKRVLMLSYSNVSVDGAFLKVAHMADLEPGQIIRYGFSRTEELIESKTFTSYQYVLNRNRERLRLYNGVN
jgi:hypothetical protein